MNNYILVAGAGGFIGGHLVKYLLNNSKFKIRAVDKKPFSEWYQKFDNAENMCLDLQKEKNCFIASENTKEIYNLAADMGGMGFIEHNKALCMLSVLTNTHLLLAAKENKTEKFFFSSSACVYNGDKQKDPNITSLKEEDAYPALAEDGYGWEKLFGERMCRHFYEDFGIQTRIARYHNVYGENGTWDGGREKAPAAICRKIILAKLSGKHEIEIWGDGNQTRSFMYIEDCIKGSTMLMQSNFTDPINIGSSQKVTINQLVDIAENIAGIKLNRKYNLNAPKGVNGRNSDNTLILEKFNWQPSVSLETGIEKTYSWIYQQIKNNQKSI